MMSDTEEPPSKVTKIELCAPLAHEESLTEEGQEEWLSEGVLTDDDYHASLPDQEHASTLGTGSLDDSTLPSLQPSDLGSQTLDSLEKDQLDSADSKDLVDNLGVNTPVDSLDAKEDKLEDQSQVTKSQLDEASKKHLESLQKTRDLETLDSAELPQQLFAHHPEPEDDLELQLSGPGVFLIRRGDGAVLRAHDTPAADEGGEDGGVGGEGDEEGERGEGAGVEVGEENDTDDLLTLLQEDKDVIIKQKVLTKTRPAARVDEDRSSDDEEMFQNTHTANLKLSKDVVVSRTTAKKAVPEKMSSDESSDEGATLKKMFASTTRGRRTDGASPADGTGNIKPTPSPLRTYSGKKPPLQKPPQQKPPPLKPPAQKPPPQKPPSAAQPKSEDESVEDDFRDFYCMEALETDLSSLGRQPLMKPETMDEEPPSDDQSDGSAGSFYDELPSSDSEDIEEWFSLDIRAERAADYVPLLGHKAHALLEKERTRVVTKLETLRESLSLLSEKSRAQTQEIEDARKSLAELDAMLAHT